jgi:ATP-dependent DNA ligase
MTVYEILKQLASTTKKLEKEAILRDHKDNEDLKESFRLAYSPTINFYIKKIPDVPVLETAIGTLREGMGVLISISERTYTGNKAIEVLSRALWLTQEGDREVLTRILLKDLRCGVGTTTINKIWKGLIPKVPQMLASSMKEKTLAKIRYPAAAELKSDGSRCIAYCSTDGVRLMSRNGSQYLGLVDLEDSLQSECFDGVVLDGELVFDTTKADRTKGNGIITKAVKGTISLEEQKGVVFQVWDVIPTESYTEKGKYTLDNDTRYELLSQVVSLADKHNVQIIPRTVVNSLDEAREVFQRYVNQGYEGIILKNTKGTWADKRSPDLVKFKEELFADLKVVGYYEGEGKIKGMLGGLCLESACGVVKTNVGSGLTEKQREVLWNNRFDLLDTIVEVKYNGLTEDKKTKQKSLFLPIFIRFREDKYEANTFEHMQ